MDKNLKYGIIIGILSIILIISLWVCYLYYNNGVDGVDNIIDLSNITCYPYSETYKICETDKYFSNGTRIMVNGLQKI
jgi:hypothetical protein